MSIHDVYYQHQVGEGRGVKNVFVGAQRMRGYGLGSWFSGLFRSALPVLAKGARAVGKEALRAGANILGDIGENNMNFKESFKNRMNESGKNLKRKAVDKINKMMEGSGYKSSTRKRRRQSSRTSAARRIASKSKIKRSKVTKVKRASKKKNKTNKKIRNIRKKVKINNKKKIKKASDIFD